MQAVYTKLGIPTPQLHVVLGSGYASALQDAAWSSNGSGQPEWEDRGSISFSEIPDLGAAATVEGHPGVYRFIEHARSKKIVCFQVGRLHGYEGLAPQKVVQTVMLARLAGVPEFILTNAAGGVNPKYAVGSIMLVADHINLTGQNPLVGPNQSHGPRFPDLSEAWSREMRDGLKAVFAKQGKLQINEGIYLGVLGPSFETPAEVSLYGKWGIGSVGMSTVWEAIALKHAGARIAGVSLISNAGCGLGDGKPLDHESILAESRKAARSIVEGIFTYASERFLK